MEKILNKALESLQNKFNITLHEKKIYRLSTPFFHKTNGDPYNIFLDTTKSNIILTDLGTTIERLLDLVDTTKSYTLHKIATIVEKYGCKVEDECITIAIEDVQYMDMYLNMYIHALICVDGLFE